MLLSLLVFLTRLRLSSCMFFLHPCRFRSLYLLPLKFFLFCFAFLLLASFCYKIHWATLSIIFRNRAAFFRVSFLKFSSLTTSVKLFTFSLMSAFHFCLRNQSSRRFELFSSLISVSLTSLFVCLVLFSCSNKYYYYLDH